MLAVKFGKTLPLCGVLGLLTLPAGAAAPDGRAAPAPHALVKEDLEAFFDGIIPLQLERSDVAGATVLAHARQRHAAAEGLRLQRS